jgi:hypothetical protein
MATEQRQHSTNENHIVPLFLFVIQGETAMATRAANAGLPTDQYLSATITRSCLAEVIPCASPSTHEAIHCSSFHACGPSPRRWTPLGILQDGRRDERA